MVERGPEDAMGEGAFAVFARRMIEKLRAATRKHDELEELLDEILLFFADWLERSHADPPAPREKRTRAGLRAPIADAAPCAGQDPRELTPRGASRLFILGSGPRKSTRFELDSVELELPETLGALLIALAKDDGTSADAYVPFKTYEEIGEAMRELTGRFHKRRGTLIEYVRRLRKCLVRVGLPETLVRTRRGGARLLLRRAAGSLGGSLAARRA